MKKILFSLVVLIGSIFSGRAAAISLVIDPQRGAPVEYALGRLSEALKVKGIELEVAKNNEAPRSTVLIATTNGNVFPIFTSDLNGKIPKTPESFGIEKQRSPGKRFLVVMGRGDRGLMYALLDVATRVSWGTNAADVFSEVKDVVESPDVVERAVSIYTMHKRYFESRLFDEEYWKRYFDLLAENRFNAFVVVFGYENGGYMAPVYPYLFDVEGFGGVRVVGFSKVEQARYRAAFHRMIAIAHERGLKVTLAPWDHIYRGGVQAGGVEGANPGAELAGVPTGLSATNLMDYSTAAFAKFLREFPEIDAVQFRMHNESGLRPGAEMREFWRRMYQVVKDVRPGLQFNARAKDFPDELIDMALEMGINLRITTKYWAEQLGLPFHPTHVNRQDQRNRRHGYADLLRYPKKYPMHWRLWTGGTTRILLWGDPEFARRFAESTHLYDGEGFEVNEMLATKMEAQPHEAEPFDLLNPKYRFYKYEFERYWHFYQVYGRIGYSVKASSEVWDREFARRFGAAGAKFEEGLHTASWVLPRINASIFPYGKFPTTRGWVEKQRWDDLPVYADAEGSDTQQFLSFNEAASNQLSGKFSAKLHPLENSAWLKRSSEAILKSVDEAEKTEAKPWSPEFVTTTTDLRILAELAAYHSQRIHAALAYALFKQTKEAADLDRAIEGETRAIGEWRKLVAAAGDVYAPDLMMGLRSVGLSGHWRDELVLLEKGLENLQKRRSDLPAPKDVVARKEIQTSREHAPKLTHDAIKTAKVGEPISIEAKIESKAPVATARVMYRGVTQYEDYKPLEMEKTDKANTYRAVVPAEAVNPKWDFMYFFEVIDRDGNGKIYPDLEKETPYHVVKLQR